MAKDALAKYTLRVQWTMDKKEKKSRQESVIEVFELCDRLTNILGEKEAIADLQIFLDNHPEMFKSIEHIRNLINDVVVNNEPDIIVKNPTPKSDKDFIAGKKLNNKKMGEVGVRRDENINKIFHANEKRLKNLRLLGKKEAVADGRDALTPYTQAQSLDGRLVENNISSTTTNIVTQNKEIAQEKITKDDIKALKEQAKESVKGLTKDSKTQDKGFEK